MKKSNKIAKTTIIDIAKASGVSVSTVSRIINDKPDVSEETRERVLSIIKKHRFAPQVSWQQLASGKSHFITLHYPQNPTRIHMMNSFVIGAAAACEAANYSLNVVVSPLDETSLLTFFRSGQTDGMLLMEIQMQDWRVELLRQNNFPFVMFGHCENNTGLNYVDFDIEAGIKMAMEHLVGLGHRQIGFVSAEPFPFTGIESVSEYGHTHWSVKGYNDACKEYGLPVICERVQVAMESIENGVLRLLAKNPQLTAIVTTQDAAITGIIKAVQNLELIIPRDISIVGMAIQQMAELTTPPLTTISAQAEASSFRAAKLLIDQLEGNSDGERQIIFPFELAVRGSTGAARTVSESGERK
jgi:DNA-binding LacI/PurR family transcriptional regulator